MLGCTIQKKELTTIEMIHLNEMSLSIYNLQSVSNCCWRSTLETIIDNETNKTMKK